IRDVKRGEKLPSSAKITLQTVATAGGMAQARVTISSSSALPTGTIELVKLVTGVPSTAGYGKVQILHIAVEAINGKAASVVSDDGIHVVARRGDANGDQQLPAADTALIRRVAAHVDSGFSAWPLIDPKLIAEIDEDEHDEKDDCAAATISKDIPV